MCEAAGVLFANLPEPEHKGLPYYWRALGLSWVRNIEGGKTYLLASPNLKSVEVESAGKVGDPSLVKKTPR